MFRGFSSSMVAMGVQHKKVHILSFFFLFLPLFDVVVVRVSYAALARSRLYSSLVYFVAMDP